MRLLMMIASRNLLAVLPYPKSPLHVPSKCQIQFAKREALGLPEPIVFGT